MTFFLFFCSIILTTSTLPAQVEHQLKLDAPLFTNESFFEPSVLKEQNVKAIHIWISEKKDGQIFEKEIHFLHYLFNSEGQLLKSYKEIRMGKKIDTSTFIFSYDQTGNCVRREEIRPPFHFVYFYHYQNQKLWSELKVDLQTGDTNYLHYFRHHQTDNIHQMHVSHQQNTEKSFKTTTTHFDSKGKKIVQRKSFSQNNSYTEIRYAYTEQDNRLKSIRETRFYSHKTSLKRILEYEGKRLEYMEVLKNGKQQYRLGFTYNHKGLVKALVKREPDRKMVSIYRFEYLYGL